MADWDYIHDPKVQELGLGRVPSETQEGIIWRGLSSGEYRNLLETGNIQSRGDYNAARDAHRGVTFYSTEPRRAEMYAHDFAPSGFKATATSPAYVIGIRQPSEDKLFHDPQNIDPTGHEVAVKGDVSISDIVKLYQGSAVLPHPEGVRSFNVILDWREMPLSDLGRPPPSEPRSTALVPLAIPPEEDPTKKRAKTKTGIGGLMKKGFWPLRIIGALQQGWDTLSDEHKTEITGFMNKPMHELVGLPPAPDLGIESYLRDLLGMASEEEITESRMQAHGGFTEDEISIATSTARSAGAVGPRALVPRTVQEVASPDDTILDFGAGPKEAHAQNLREDGFNVTAWDFGKNPEALYRQYDIVYASNVLNVQSSLDMLERTVGQIADLVRPGGTFIGNLPLSPRKSPDLNPETLETILLQYFENIERVGGKSNAPVYMAKKLQEKVRKAHGGFIDKPLYERTL
jgi:hypothetical protein